ncbi:hypothetical protein, partial [Klebsiella pneumoniae]|uniref:hypothetical protein n=1 Tax=Klebsiella pneumoniae TaxID=573 RepID=UPI00195365CE
IAGTARFPWLESLSYAGDILETAVSLIEPTDVLFGRNPESLADPFSIEDLRSVLQDRLGEPRWSEMFSLMPVGHLHQHAA